MGASVAIGLVIDFMGDFMAGFMGERERMNRMIIDQMLAAADPTKLAEAENDARKAKNDLLKLKAQVQVEGRKADVGLVKVIAGFKSAEMQAQSRVDAAAVAQRGANFRALQAGESKRSRAIQAGEQAAESALGPVKDIRTVTSGPQAQIGEYNKGIKASIELAGAGRGLGSGDTRNAATRRIAGEAYELAKSRGHTESAAFIKQTYFGNLEPSVVAERERPMTIDEIRTYNERVPVGGGRASRSFMSVLGGEGATPEQITELRNSLTGDLSRSMGAEMQQRLGPYMNDPEVTEAAMGGAEEAISLASQGVPTGDIDTAIADIDKQISSLQAQRSRRPSLASVAAGRYPNYLYSNPFQVGSRQFDQFARETGAMDPVAAQRLVGALAEAPPVFPARFARRELERTDPAQVEVEGFRPTGGETGGGVLEELSKRFQAAEAVAAAPMAIGDRGDIVTFTDKGASIKENTPEGRTVTAPIGSTVYNDLRAQALNKAAQGSGLSGFLASLPAAYQGAELAGVIAATERGGFGAGRAEARRQAKAGDVPLATVYAEELERVGRIENAAEREDALQTLVASLPEKAEWAQAMRGVAEAPVEDTGRRATSLAKQIKDAYTAPEGEVSLAERKAALAGQKTAAERAALNDRAFMPENQRSTRSLTESQRVKQAQEDLAEARTQAEQRRVSSVGEATRTELPTEGTRLVPLSTPDGALMETQTGTSAEDEAREAALKKESARLGASMDERLGLVATPSVSQAPAAEQAVREALAKGNLTPKTDVAVESMSIPSAAAARGYLPAVEQKGAMPMSDFVPDVYVPGYKTMGATPVPRSAPDKAAQARIAAQGKATQASREKARMEEVARNAAKVAKTAPATKPVPATAPAPASKPAAKAPTRSQAELDAAAFLED
jgi:hypothetical protein